MPPEQQQSAPVGPKNDDRFIDNLLDTTEDRLERLDNLVDTIDIDDPADLLYRIPLPPTQEEIAQRTQDVLQKYSDVTARLEEVLTDEEFATLNIDIQESNMQLAILPPRYDGTVRISFMRGGERVGVEEGWTFQESMDRPEPPAALLNAAVVLEDANSSISTDQQSEYDTYVVEGKEGAQHEALLRAISQLPVSPELGGDVPPNDNNDEPDTPSDEPSTPVAPEEPQLVQPPEESEDPENRLVATFNKLLDKLFTFISQKFPKLGKLLGIENEEKRKVTQATVRAVRAAGADGTLDDADVQTIARAINADPAFAGADVDSRIQGIQVILAGETSIESLSPEQTVAFEQALRSTDVSSTPTPEPTEPDVPPPEEDDFIDSITPLPAIGDLRQQTELLLDTAAMERVNRTIEAMDLSETERNSLVIEVNDTLTLTKYPPTYVGNVRVSYIPDNQDGTVGEERDRIGSEVPWSYEGVWGADQDNIVARSVDVGEPGALDPGFSPPSASGIDSGVARAEEQKNRDGAVSKAILDALKTIKIGDPVVLGDTESAV